MDEQTFKSRVEKILEIANVVEKLRPEIRSQTFALLAPYAGDKLVYHKPDAGADDSSAGPSAGTGGEGDGREAFFGQHDHSKPSDNVKLIFAYWYSQYGNVPLPVTSLKTLADEVGLTIPDRFNMTLQNAQANNKSLFIREGRGAWRPTVHGEANLKENYKVRKGNKTPPSTE